MVTENTKRKSKSKFAGIKNEKKKKKKLFLN